MTRYLLDTNIVSSPISKTPNAGILRRIEGHEGECAIAAPVWHELTYGVSRLPRGRRRKALDVYLKDVVRASFPILAYDDASATWHAQERARLEALGRVVPYVDAQIASIARSNNLILVTMNETDFSGFKDLKIENWSSR